MSLMYSGRSAGARYANDLPVLGLLWAHVRQAWSDIAPLRRPAFSYWSWAGRKGKLRFTIANWDNYDVLRI
jgi:hypothetical protein